jgi:hypothetical protein
VCRPFDAGRHDANIAGKSDNVSFGVWRIDVAELRVQVAEYVQYCRRI